MPARRYLFYASQPYALPVARPLQAEIRSQGGETAWFFDGPGADFLRDDERLLRTVAEVRAFAPRAVFVPGNTVPDFFPGVKVEIFHGFSVGKRSDARGHFRIRGFFDLYCTHGSTTTPTFSKLAAESGHFHVTETGWPKIDPLFQSSPPDPGHWRDGLDPRRPVILYASTFTPALSSAAVLEEHIRTLAREGDWNWLVTLHPKMPGEIVRGYRALEGPHLRFAETDDAIPLLQAADVMVSDTSSIVFEFLMQNRPVVTLRNTRPGPHLINIETPAELEPAIRRALSPPPELGARIAEFTRSIHPYRDGRSSARVLAATEDFIQRHHGRLKPKPANIWRKLQLRRKLGYYAWR